MSVINTNITSMIAQANLQKTQSSLQTAMERLSSGLRINSAKDDAAGQAIANRFTAQITGLNQASRNANDGISIAQTAEGSLNQINDNLQRIRELSVQAANGTNSDNDLESIQQEINQRLDEINRISEETDFNGVKVLREDNDLKVQVGANDGESITVSLQQINSSTLGLGSFQVNNTLLTENLSAAPVTETVAPTLNIEDATFNNTAGATTWDVYVLDADPDQLYVSRDGGTTAVAATYDPASNALSFDSSGEAAVAGISAAGSSVAVGGGVTMETADITGRIDTNPAAVPELFVNELGTYVVSLDGGTTYYDATVDLDSASATYGEVSFDSSGAAAVAANTTNLSAALDQVSDPEAAVPIDVSGLDANLVGADAQVYAMQDGSGYVVQGEDTDGNTVYYSAEVDQGTGVVTLGDQLTTDPLAALDTALNQVDSLRSALGAVQNRFEDAIVNLNTNSTNLSAARSRIEDADYAMEVGNLTRAQILQQAGTSVLAQANQIPQNVLSLLG